MAEPQTDPVQAAPVPAPEPAFFDNPAIDNLIAVTLELGAELWLQKERTRVIEHLLAQRGVVTRELIDAHVDSDEEAARITLERAQFVNRVFGLFARQTVRGTPAA